MDEINNLELDDVIVENEKNVNLKFKDNMNFVSKEFGITRNVPLQSIFKESKFKGDDTNIDNKKDEQKTEKIQSELQTNIKGKKYEIKNQVDGIVKNLVTIQKFDQLLFVSI